MAVLCFNTELSVNTVVLKQGHFPGRVSGGCSSRPPWVRVAMTQEG